jgi:hypothetical protein
MVPKLMLDGMPYQLQEVTASGLADDGYLKSLPKIVQNNLISLQIKNKGTVDNGYWISFVEIMDSNGDWFVPKVQYAFHVFPVAEFETKRHIYNMFKIKNIYVRNTQGNNTWKLVNRNHGFGGHSRPIPDDDQVTQGGGKWGYGPQVSENSHIWTMVDDIDLSTKPNYVVSEWIDISSFAFRELLLRDIDPEEGELKMLIQVAADMNKFQAAINKEAI